MLRKKHLLYYSGTLVCFLFVFVMSIQRAAVAENKPASKEITQRNLLVDREVWTSMESRRRGNDSQLAQLNIDDESNWILDYPYERSKTRWGTMAYEKPINFYCATLFIDIDFLKCPQKNSYFGFRFNDIEQNGTKIEIKFYPNQNRVSCGNIIKAYVPRPEAPLRLELVVQLTKDTLKLKYGHNTLIDTPIKYVNPNHQLFAFILSQSKVKINKLVAAIPSDALPQIKYNNVSIAPIQKQLKSPFLAYFGTHYSGPKDFGKRFSAVRGYGGTHTRLSRQPKDIAGIEPRIGPFSGKPVKIRLEDFHSQSQHTKNPKNATQLFPEITECGLTALFVIPTGSVFEDEPFDRDYAYWFYRLAHERYPKLKEYAIWQIGNEIVSRH